MGIVLVTTTSWYLAKKHGHQYEYEYEYEYKNKTVMVGYIY